MNKIIAFIGQFWKLLAVILIFILISSLQCGVNRDAKAKIDDINSKYLKDIVDKDATIGNLKVMINLNDIKIKSIENENGVLKGTIADKEKKQTTIRVIPAKNVTYDTDHALLVDNYKRLETKFNLSESVNCDLKLMIENKDKIIDVLKLKLTLKESIISEWELKFKACEDAKGKIEVIATNKHTLLMLGIFAGGLLAGIIGG